jgi:heterodisulfide reductase subunit A
MYSMKEAIIAKEHAEGMDATIFYMDIRAPGKQFEEYYLRSQDEYKIKFIRSRVASIEEDPETHNLTVRYLEDGNPKLAEFDMVVLALGFRPPKDVKKVSETFGIDLNEYGFAKTDVFGPLDTSKPGVFVSGAFASPKDIPETVAQASGAAARAGVGIAAERHTMITVKEYPPEITVKKDDEPRIGVFICHCGINIGGTVNVPEVVEYAAGLPNVAYAERNLYTCSQDTQEKIKEKIKEHNLNRVIVASCTPRTHEPLFQNTCKEGGLNPYLFEMANIREHCSWVHMHEPEKATAKAKDMVRIAVAKSRLHEPLYKGYLDVNKACLVIGGGVAGMVAAKTLADQDFPVHLVEKENELGGLMRKIHYLPEKEVDPQDKLKKLIKEIESHDNITVYKGATVKSAEGSVGSFKTVIAQGDKETEVGHGTAIVAIGAKVYEPTEYLFNESDRVITQMDFEEKLSKGKLDGDRVVMIQCVGSRNETNKNCSRICCTEAMKNALKLKEIDPGAEVYILNKDIRTFGFKELFYREARGKGVHIMRYEDDRKPEVKKDGDRLRVEIHDDILGKTVSIPADYVVLSVGAVPNPDNEELAKIYKISTTHEKYFLEAHMKLRPVDFATEGVYLAGMAHGPKFVEECISQALGAAARATTVLANDQLELEATKSFVVDKNCDGCAFCVDPCPYNAITLIEYKSGDTIKKTIQVDETACKGCGVCMATCPKEGIYVKNFRLEQLKAMIQAALEVV